MEFLQLKEENMTLTDYEKKFDQVTRYASHLVNIEAMRIKRFQKGHHQDISMIIMSHRFTTYNEMLEKLMLSSIKALVPKIPNKHMC